MDVQEEIRQLPGKLLLKWLSVPYAILAVVAGGASYNLYSYFQFIGKLKHYGSSTNSMIWTTVLFGYYLGILPGAIIAMTNNTRIVFIIGAIASLISFIVLGYVGEHGEASALNWLLMISMLFIGSTASAFATITAIVSSVRNFPRMLSMAIMAILIGYYKMAPYLEFWIRTIIFTDTPYFTYFIFVGIVLCIIFLGAAFAIQVPDIDDKYHNYMKNIDNVTMYIYVVVEVIFAAILFLFTKIYNEVTIGVISFILVLILNFVIFGFSISMMYNNITSMEKGIISLKFPPQHFYNKSFGTYLCEIKYICSILASFIVIGVCSTFNMNIYQTALDIGAVDSITGLMIALWLIEIVSRIGGGLLAYSLVESVNGYIFLIVGAALSSIGFVCALLADSMGTTFLYTACVLTAVGLGIFWVVVPQVIMDDAGPDWFGMNWGLSLLLTSTGIVVFGNFYDMSYNYYSDGKTQCTSGAGCTQIQHIAFAVLCVIASILCYISLVNDDPVGYSARGASESQDTEKGLVNDKNKKSSKSSSKDKQKSDSKPKSKSKNKAK